jgi:hypothetical protein
MLRYCLLLFLFISRNLSAQDKVAFGVSGTYNFPFSLVGIGLRAQIPFSEKIQAVPQIKYYPTFNQFHEVYGGLSLHYSLLSPFQYAGGRVRFEPTKPNFYLTAGFEYNRWFNYAPNENKKSKKDNILPEVGAGISVGSNAVRVFFEAKYNVLWDESYGEFGLLIYPFNLKQNRKNNCPKVN